MRRSLLTKLAAVVSALTLLALLALPAGAQGVAAVSVSPAAVVAGATVSIEINNLWGAENVGIWFTGPSGVVVAYTKQIVTDTSGHVAFAYQTPTSLADGTWMATVQGLSSKRQATTSFTILPPGEAEEPNITNPVVLSVSPEQAAPGDKLTFSVSGLWGAENVGAWFTGPGGVVIGVTNQIVTDPGGKVTFTYQTAASMATGTWMVTVQGLSSKRMEVGSFTLAAP